MYDEYDEHDEHDISLGADGRAWYATTSPLNTETVAAQFSRDVVQTAMTISFFVFTKGPNVSLLLEG